MRLTHRQKIHALEVFGFTIWGIAIVGSLHGDLQDSRVLTSVQYLGAVFTFFIYQEMFREHDEKKEVK